MIIECAGLPGAGKTTICNAVRVAYEGKGSVPLRKLRIDRLLLRAAWRIFLLCAAARPLKLDRLRRGFNLVAFLRHYQDGSRTLLFDQGQIQKLWSILKDAEGLPADRLQQVLQALAPFAPAYVVWVETTPATSAVRVSERRNGNSRYDGLPQATIDHGLSERKALLNDVAHCYCKATGAKLHAIDGNAPVAVNAAKIDALFSR
jgi:thymidylate kinase